MPITAIQPITDFSVIVPPTPTAPAELVSVASDLVTTPTSSTVVTLGETQPLRTALFDASGQLVTGTRFQSSESQALAGELQSAIGASSARFDSFAAALTAATVGGTGTGGTGGTATGAGAGGTGGTSPSFAALALEMSILNAAGLTSAGSANASSPTDFSGVLGTQLELAIAGIGTGTGTATATGNAVNATTTAATAPSPALAAANANTVTAIPTTPTATATPATATATPANATAVTPAGAVTATTTPAAATATGTPTPAIATPTATTAGATAATGTTGTAGTAPITTTGTAGAPMTAADVLQRLVADVTGRAVSNLIDPGFASTSAGMFVSAAIFRAMNNDALSSTTMGTADIAGTPAAPVTAIQAPRPV